jgi:hypothetical protein
MSRIGDGNHMRKKVTKKKSSPKKTAPRPKAQKPIGFVTHYYGDIRVGIVKFSAPVRAGTLVEFRGSTTNFSQELASMQYDHKVIAKAPKGKQVGVKVKKRVREGDKVFAVK